MDKVRKMMRSLIAAALAASASAVMNGTGTVYFDGANFNVSLGVLDCTNGVACGSYIDMSLKPISSFGELSITTNNKFNDSVQMFAAGFLEGALTTEVCANCAGERDWHRSPHQARCKCSDLTSVPCVNQLGFAAHRLPLRQHGRLDPF